METKVTALGLRGSLYYRGNLDLVGRPKVAIVGARASTAYGNQVASQIAHAVVSNGGVVLSGGAYGIDSAAHVGALADGGPTIAVVATGLDKSYPLANASMFAQIEKTGLMLSEHPDGTPPSRERFLARNRLLVDLADAVVIVEGSLRSGTRSTADEAVRLNKPLWAVPGPVTSILSALPNALLDGTARPVTDLSAMPYLTEGGVLDEAPTH